MGLLQSGQQTTTDIKELTEGFRSAGMPTGTVAIAERVATL